MIPANTYIYQFINRVQSLYNWILFLLYPCLFIHKSQKYLLNLAHFLLCSWKRTKVNIYRQQSQVWWRRCYWNKTTHKQICKFFFILKATINLLERNEKSTISTWPFKWGKVQGILNPPRDKNHFLIKKTNEILKTIFKKWL